MSDLKDQLNKLNQRVDELEKNPSELTKDALLAEVRAFYDSVKNAEVKPAAKPAKSTSVVKEVAAVEPVIQPKAVQEGKAPEPVVEAPKPVAEVPNPVAEKPEPVAQVQEPVIEIPKKVVEESVAEVKAVVEAPVAEEKPKAKKEPMIGKEEPASKAADKKILAGKFNQEPLADLRSGIPLNEKFGIIRNLFKGNASDFGDAVLKLNNAANAKEMKHYLDLLAARFEWDDRTEAYQSFMGYVERKILTLQPSNADADQ